ncbi:MAG: DUF2256 domain-containing protein [Gemmatimonadota bacterium]
MSPGRGRDRGRDRDGAAAGDRSPKVCARCGRPFTWRKKWARDWAQGRYCSDKCRMGKAAATA